MKVLTWNSPFHWGSPNLRWGSPSHILEPGDPGYVGPPPPPSTTKGKRIMSNNPIPENMKVVLAMAEDCYDGCVDHQDSVGLKQTRSTDLGPLLTNLKGNVPTTPVPPGAPPPPPPPPPEPGLIYLYDEAKTATAAAEAAVLTKDEQVRQFLSAARDVLKNPLGKSWSPEWVLAGFTETGSTAVPNTQDERFASISTLAVYLSQHSQHEVPGGGPVPEITASRAQNLHIQLSDARRAVNDATTAQRNARDARDAAIQTLRKRLIAFVDELTLLLGPDDPRWELFGLNIPASPRPPEPASALLLTPAGPGRFIATWTRGARSSNNRVLIQIIGTDPDYREYAKSGNSTEKLISDQPTGATLKVKIIALNGSLEAPDGPEAQIVVP